MSTFSLVLFPAVYRSQLRTLFECSVNEAEDWFGGWKLTGTANSFRSCLSIFPNYRRKKRSRTKNSSFLSMLGINVSASKSCTVGKMKSFFFFYHSRRSKSDRRPGTAFCWASREDHGTPSKPWTAVITALSSFECFPFRLQNTRTI